MEYSKPKVTIDLDEYNELKELEKNFDKIIKEHKEDVKPYQLALAGIVQNFSHDLKGMERLTTAMRSLDVEVQVKRINGNFVEVHCEMKKLNEQS